MTNPDVHTRTAWRAAVILLLATTVSATAQPTRVVRADGKPAWGASARLALEFTIGQVDGPPEVAFGSVIRAAADAGGGFYLFDQKDTQIRRYDARGAFVSSIGRKGAGPGEYQSVTAMEVTTEGLLFVYDPASRRITYFQPDGKVRRDVSLARGFDWRGATIDTAGRIYVTARLPGPREGPGARYQFVRLSSAGAIIDSIAHPVHIGDVAKTFCLITADGRRCNFTSETLIAPYRLGGIITAESHRYRVNIHDGAGHSLIIERSHSPVRLRGDERREWLAWASYQRTQSRIPGASYDIPSQKPAVRDLLTDTDGRIWVGVYTNAEKRHEAPRAAGDRRPLLTWKERTTYDVFSSAGTYLGRLQLPPDAQILTIRASRVFLRTKGEEDEDRVAVFRIVSGSRP